MTSAGSRRLPRVADLQHLHHLPIWPAHVKLVLVMILVHVGHHFLDLHRLAAHRVHETPLAGEYVPVAGAFGDHHARGHLIDPDVDVFLFGLVVTAKAHAAEGLHAAAHV